MDDVRPIEEGQLRNRVWIRGQAIFRSLRDDDPERWQRLLRSVYRSRGGPECLCNGEKQTLALSVARHGAALVLRRMPGDGPKHHPLCESYGAMVEPAGSGNRNSAIQAALDGRTDINVDVPLSVVTSSAPEKTDTLQASTRKKQREGISLLGLLQFLWERAGMNQWVPPGGGARGERTLGMVYSKLAQELEELSIRGRHADAVCYVPEGSELDEQKLRGREAAFQAQLDSLIAGSTATSNPILVLVAEVRQMFPSKYGMGMKVKGMSDAFVVWIDEEQSSRIHEQWVHEMRLLNAQRQGQPDKEAGRVIVAVGVKRKATGRLGWVYGALMATNHDYIPTGSEQEAAVADALVRQHRAFKRPLRYLGDGEAPPSFILTDVNPPVDMEVRGPSPSSHRGQMGKRTKMRESDPAWSWEPSTGQSLPAFPSVPKTAASLPR